MDDFGFDRPELSGTLMNLEFGTGGRVQQLWVADPTHPDGEEFQFVCPPMGMGDEFTEDYLPGTVLLGIRTHPEEPWQAGRNFRADVLEDDGPGVAFRYDFGVFDDIEAIGRFQELGGQIPTVAWDLTLRNATRRSVEIGELGFPLALNNVQEGFPRTDKGVRDLFHDRVVVHAAANGSASYVYASRLIGRAPGLVVFPGEDTRWEFVHHVPASLRSPFRWEGIPVVYVHSQATVEREGWPEWFDGHSGTILEPGEERRYQLRFAPADRDGGADGASAVLAALGRPVLRLFPGAVAPREVGIAIEVGGATPTRFDTERPVETETDADEDGGYCYVRPEESGPLTVGFDDTEGRRGWTQLLFTEPIADLIEARAEYIVDRQTVAQGPLRGAILPTDDEERGLTDEVAAVAHPFGLLGSLCDALFLAEKNALVPVAAQIGALERYRTGFLETSVVNPGDGSVGSVLPNVWAVAVGYGRPEHHALVALFYAALAAIRPAEREALLDRAVRTAEALFANTELPTHGHVAGILLDDLADRLRRHGRADAAAALSTRLEKRWRRLVRAGYPFGGDALAAPVAFAETWLGARRVDAHETADRAVRLAYANRSASPSWWWYAMDKRWADEPENHPLLLDRAAVTGGPGLVLNALPILEALRRDAPEPPELHLRLAFGGLTAVWAFVRPDGAATFGYVPDVASDSHGVLDSSGDVGLSLYLYLRWIGAYVVPSRAGVQSFGAFFEVEGEGAEEAAIVRPWDGVGRRISVRQLGVDVVSEGAEITELRFGIRKRWLTLDLRNRGESDLVGPVRVRGLWGAAFRVNGVEAGADGPWLAVPTRVPPGGTLRLEIEAV